MLTQKKNFMVVVTIILVAVHWLSMKLFMSKNTKMNLLEIFFFNNQFPLFYEKTHALPTLSSV